MGNRRKRIAFIPVRGGSKSILKKNIKPMVGKPLVYWVIDAALDSKIFDEIIISTDDENIRDVVLKHHQAEKLTIVNRSKSTATDSATTESAMIEYTLNHVYDEITLIQATSPLLESKDLIEAYHTFSSAAEADSLLSVCRQERFIWKKAGEYFKPINYSPLSRPRRQDFNGFLVENGAFYITSRENLLRTKSRLSGNIICYEMSASTYFELDEPSDWEIIENLLQRKTKSLSIKKLENIKLFLTDVDGVLTDSGMYYSESGDELKKFNTRDGKGLELLRNRGIKIGIVTTENTKIVSNRAKKLKADFLYQGRINKGKLDAAIEICGKIGISLKQAVYIGDDINDLELLRNVGFSVCPADASKEVKETVDYICKKKGGKGCVREIVEIILGNERKA